MIMSGTAKKKSENVILNKSLFSYIFIRVEYILLQNLIFMITQI